MQKMVDGKLVDLTEEEIKAREEEAKRYAEHQRKTEYKIKRKMEYPSPDDQLELVMKQLEYWRTNGTIDLLAETEAMLDKILEVKTKYPKPAN